MVEVQQARFRSPAIRPSRQVVEWVIGLIIFALVARVWLVDGWLQPIAVAGGSMAPALLGPHHQIDCSNCGFGFTFDVESPPANGRAICPNCGWETSIAESEPAMAGDRLLVNRAAFAFRSPRRGELVLIRSPENGRDWCIKRVVGMPGETMQILHGDLYANGEIVRKTLPELLATAVLVHDDRQRPRLTKRSQRWQPATSDSHWQTTDDGYQWKAGGKVSTDWLVYHHAGGPAARPDYGEPADASNSSAGILVEGPILDELAYNQGESRMLIPVTDLVLRCQVKAAQPGEVMLRIYSGSDEFVAKIDNGAGTCDLLHNVQPVASAAIGQLPLARGATVELAVADHQVQLALDGRTLLVYAIEDAPPPPRHRVRSNTVRQPLAIGARGLEVRASELQVWRDIYYVVGPGVRDPTTPSTEFRFGDDEYFVLGDNPSVSVDSRGWPGHGGISRNLLLGKPLASWHQGQLRR